MKASTIFTAISRRFSSASLRRTRSRPSCSRSRMRSKRHDSYGSWRPTMANGCRACPVAVLAGEMRLSTGRILSSWSQSKTSIRTTTRTWPPWSLRSCRSTRERSARPIEVSPPRTTFNLGYIVFWTRRTCSTPRALANACRLLSSRGAARPGRISIRARLPSVFAFSQAASWLYRAATMRMWAASSWFASTRRTRWVRATARFCMITVETVCTEKTAKKQICSSRRPSQSRASSATGLIL